MNDFMWEVWKFLMLLLGIALAVGCIAIFTEIKIIKEEKPKLISDNYERGYLDACKDFKKGKIKYALVKNDDGTVIWKKVDKR